MYHGYLHIALPCSFGGLFLTVPSFISQVFDRLEKALNILLEKASSSDSKSIVAVTHSIFLRILLAALSETPLLQAATLEQNNCCVNVVDFTRRTNIGTSHTSNRIISSQSLLFGGILSQAPKDYIISVPEASILRINEKRHLALS